MAIDYDELERWALSAAQELQEFCDAAQAEAGNPDGEDQLPATRGLLRELDCIIAGQPTWRMMLKAKATELEHELNIDFGVPGDER